jgi:hypothetical protein
MLVLETALTDDITKAVVAILAELSPSPGVVAVGVPVKSGLSNDIFESISLDTINDEERTPLELL